MQLLRSDGPAAVTMAAVADSAGCSRRAVYLHFASRAELFVSLIAFTDETEGLAEELRIVEEATSGVDQLRRFGLFLGRYHTKIAPVVLALVQERHRDDAAQLTWEAAMQNWHAACRAALSRVRADGELHPRFDSLDDAVDLMWSLMSIDVLRALVHERGWPAQKYGHYLGEVFVATFARLR